MPLSDVRYQRPALVRVQRALTGARIPHAYLFHGPEGVGKEMFAERLSRVLLCENPHDITPPPLPELAGWKGPFRDACGVCRSCHLAEVGNHPDIHVIHRQLKALHPEERVRRRSGAELVVDVVRHFIVDAVGLAPVAGRSKVFIVREAERMNDNAQNALLKTLEEPPPSTFLILITSSAHLLLSTTRSRCQQALFGPLPDAFITERIAATGLSAADAGFYAALGAGSLGLALQYAADGFKVSYEKIAGELTALNRCSGLGAAKTFLEIAKEMTSAFSERDPDLSDSAAMRQAIGAVFMLAANWYRAIMHSHDGAAGAAITPAGAPALARVSQQAAAEAISLLATAERQLELNVNTQLVVETTLFKLAGIDETFAVS
jgi:DNA polymerase-3 subunit delta'